MLNKVPSLHAILSHGARPPRPTVPGKVKAVSYVALHVDIASHFLCGRDGNGTGVTSTEMTPESR